MHDIAEHNDPFVRKVVKKDDALKFFKEKKDPYKVEIITALDETITFYSEGEFTTSAGGPMFRPPAS